MKALAISNNDMVYLRWRVDQKIPDAVIHDKIVVVDPFTADCR
jgi:hypothetical protein